MDTATTAFTPTLDWLLSGNATLVVESTTSTWPSMVGGPAVPGPASMAFSVSKAKDKVGQVLSRFFVWTRNVLDLDDTRGVYLGFFDARPGQAPAERVRLAVGRTGSMTQDGCRQRRVFEWALEHVRREMPMAAGFTLGHAGRCGACGRELTDPESIARGLGPTCATK